MEDVCITLCVLSMGYGRYMDDSGYVGELSRKNDFEPLFFEKKRHWLAQTSQKTILFLLLAIQIDCKKTEVFILLCS